MQTQAQQKEMEEIHHSPFFVARMLGVNPETVRKWARQGKIESIRCSGVLRIPHSTYLKILKSGVPRKAKRMYAGA